MGSDILKKIAASKSHQLPESMTEEMVRRYDQGISFFEDSLKNNCLYPKAEWTYEKIDLEQKLEIHNYTGKCPTLTYEISPVKGCQIGCLYCLVTDGVHEQPLIVYDNYGELVKKALEKERSEPHYYYFSAKTEAFQRPTVETGVAHNILKTFISHYEQYPDSKARLFIASKAGINTINQQFEGNSLLDLFVELKGKMQFNTSISMMPEYLHPLLEPGAESMDNRLKAVEACGAKGIEADSALVQPILPFMIEDNYLDMYFKKLSEVGIINHKPEFLTACIENLAMIGKIIGYYEPDKEKLLYDAYFTPENMSHVKQRSRMAPRKEVSKALLDKILMVAKKHGVSASICYWVRQALDISEDMIPIINDNGFQCLGYQSKLLKEQ